MSEKNKQLIREWFDALNRRDVDAFVALLAEDAVNHHSTNQGREGARAEIEYWFAAFPDATVTVEDLIAEGDRVVARVSASGTQDGEFMGAPPSGKRIQVQEIDVVRIEDGRIAEVWPAPDIFGMMQQLGLVPANA